MLDRTSSSLSSISHLQIYGTLNSKYILYHQIGKGLSSKVYLAKSTSQKESSPTNKNNLYAIKICKRSYNSKLFYEESLIMRKFTDHSHIIKYYETGKAQLTKKKSSKTKTVHYHVLEYAENDILFTYINIINSSSKGFGERMGRIIFSHILSAVEECHRNGIAHKDIKSENIILTSDYKIKLIDFGFSVDINNTNANINRSKYSVYGTNGFFPPEVYICNDYKCIDPFQCDYFALGVTLFEIVCGFRPFNAAKRLDVNYKKIWRRNYDKYWNELPYKTNHLSGKFKEFIMKFLAMNPKERFTSIEEIRKDKWYVEGDLDGVGMNDKNNEMKWEFEYRKKKNHEYKMEMFNNNVKDAFGSCERKNSSNGSGGYGQ